MSTWRAGSSETSPRAIAPCTSGSTPDGPASAMISGTSQRGFVREQPVRGLAVIAERFAVIAGNDDERRPRDCGAQPRTADRARRRRPRLRRNTVDPRTRDRTAAAADRARAARRRGPRRASGHRPARRIHDVASATTADAGRSTIVKPPPVTIVEAPVVDVEPRRQAEPCVEREGGHERTRREAARLQDRRERRHPRLQPVATVFAVAVLKRVGAGEDARVRRQRHDCLGVGERKADASCRNRIDVGRARQSAVRNSRASPRSVSIVTRRTFCSGFAARMSPRTVARVPQ